MVEQDLVISRALAEIYAVPEIAERLAFRGGTALYKLYLRPAARYSEDIRWTALAAASAQRDDMVVRASPVFDPATLPTQSLISKPSTFRWQSSSRTGSFSGNQGGAMGTLDLLKDAIEARTPISFHYDSADAPGVRTGHPHAVFIRRLKDGREKVYVDVWMTGGVTFSGSDNPWRKFSFEKISSVRSMPGGPFSVADGYNSDSYEFPLAKV